MLCSEGVGSTPGGAVMRERSGQNKPSSVDPSNLYAQVALEAALDALGTPAFIVGRTGELLFASERAQQLLDRDSIGTLDALSAAVAGTQREPPFELRPLHRGTELLGFFVILRSTPEPEPFARSLDVAVARWKLTVRQAEVLSLVARGLTNATIAEMLNIRETTVEFHLRAVFDKAGVDNRATLVARVLEL
jgi:DNA-binding CsgD family transcriptional regulator